MPLTPLANSDHFVILTGDPVKEYFLGHPLTKTLDPPLIRVTNVDILDFAQISCLVGAYKIFIFVFIIRMYAILWVFLKY